MFASTLHHGGSFYFYFIKCMRLFRCQDVFDVSKIMRIYKKQSKEHVDQLIKDDPLKAYDIENDIIHISRLIMFGKIF